MTVSDSPASPRFDPASDSLIGLAHLLHCAYARVDLKPLAAELIAYAEAHPENANCLMDLSVILQLFGDHAIAAATQLEALDMRQAFHLPTTRGKPAALRMLAIMVPGDFMANTPLEFLLAGSDIALDLLYVTPRHPLPDVLPDHDVLFVAVGEKDDTKPVLAQLGAALAGRPLLNAPSHLLNLARDAAAALLQDQPSIRMPLTARVDRATLAGLRPGAALHAVLADGEYPLIARPIGSHAGHGLDRLDDASAIDAYLADQPGNDFYVSRFIDYRNLDGLFRKYRIAFVDGRPFLCHLAVSDHWMIHYLNAGMEHNQAKRDEEAAAMRDFDQGFAARHRQAFEALHRAFPLAYFGIDCAETPDGRLLVFEVDTAMIVHDMDPVDLFPYKPASMHKLFDAFQAMVRRHAVLHPAR